MLTYRSLVTGAAVLVLAAPVTAQNGDKKPGKHENRALSAMALAGQQVAVLPITMVVADPAAEPDSLYEPWRERASALRRADSLIVRELQMRGPEVTWVTPDELRRLARRAPGMVSNPDEMGQAMLRSPRLERIPDHLAASLRRMVAIAGGRMVLVPAALGFSHADSAGFRADLSLALVDTRRNEVVWRSVAVGRGAGPDAALRSALLTVFPE